MNGGAGKVALESAQALTDHVDHVYVFSAVGEIPETMKGRDRLTVISLGQSKVTERPAREAIWDGLWNREAQAKFHTLLDSLHPSDTVVHLHSWRDALTASPIAVAINRGFKVLVTCHDFGLACPLAGFFDEKDRTICHQTGMGIGCITKSCTGGSFIKKSWFVARHGIQVRKGRIPSAVKHFAFVSKFSEQILSPYLPTEAKRHFVANPISAEHRPKAEPATSDSFVYIGRFSPEKAPDVAAAATHVAGVPIKFVGIGPLGDRLQQLNPEAELMGWRPPHEVTEILRGSRALIFPSIWYETQGMVVNEAAANGIPVIVSDCTAAVDTIVNLGHGLKFKAGSIEDLVEKITALKSDDLVTQLSQTGYDAFWASPPTIESHAEELMKVYSEVLAD